MSPWRSTHRNPIYCVLLHCPFSYPALTTNMSHSWNSLYISILSAVDFVVPTWAFVGRRGLENLATGHGTWEREEVVGEVVRGVWATENIPRMSSVRGNHLVRQQHAVFPLQPHYPPGRGADPGRIVTVGSIRNRFVWPFLLCPPLTHDNTCS